MFEKAARHISFFEAEISRQGVPAGSENPGHSFEVILGEGFGYALERLATKAGVELLPVRTMNAEGLVRDTSQAVAVRRGGRTLVLALPKLALSPALTRLVSKTDSVTLPEPMLARSFVLDAEAEMNSLPQEDEYLPELADIEGFDSLAMMQPSTGRGRAIFDGRVLFIEDRKVVGQGLIEAKSAKSSDAIRLDGNAHERVSHKLVTYAMLLDRKGFEGMQLLVMTNEAFFRYDNNFTGIFLRAINRFNNTFPGCDAGMISESRDYARMFLSWQSWLLGRTQSVPVATPVRSA